MIQLALIVNAVLFGGFGILLFFWPDKISLAQIAISHPTALNEIRAFYGGLEIGYAAFLLLAWRNPAWQQPALWLVCLILGGITAARLYSLGVDGREGSYVLYAMALEIPLLIFSAYALSRSSTSV